MGDAFKKWPAGGSDDLKWLELASQRAGSLRSGVVHDLRVSQIEKTERLRRVKAAAGQQAGQARH
jgi:hypothetical protein